MPHRQDAEASRSIKTGGVTISARGARKGGWIAMGSPFDWRLEGNSHGSTDPRALNATLTLANTTWAGPTCQTKRPAKSPVNMPHRGDAEASRSIRAAGGVNISALGATKGGWIALGSPFDWRIDQ